MKNIIRYVLKVVLASVLMSSCTIMYRGVRYGGADIDDHEVFVTHDMAPSGECFKFITADESRIDTVDIDKQYNGTTYHQLDRLLEQTSTRQFVVIRNDTLLYNKAFGGHRIEDISTIFSVSKSITSLLIGIALDEGHIKDVNDPVTDYLGELKKADPMFQKLTVKHLLDMRSGLDVEEAYGWNPFSNMARLYYGRHQQGIIKSLHFKSEPGSEHDYLSICTSILGLVIESATERSFADYFEEKVWDKLAMENQGKWSLDDKKHRSAKAFGGLSISAIDLAKIGRLYLNGGVFNGNRVVSKEWVNETLSINIENDGYRDQWYGLTGKGKDTLGVKYFDDRATAQQVYDEKYKDEFQHYQIKKVEGKEGKEQWILEIFLEKFYGLGIHSQVLFIDPSKNTILVRLGDHGDMGYVGLMYHIDNSL